MTDPIHVPSHLRDRIRTAIGLAVLLALAVAPIASAAFTYRTGVGMVQETSDGVEVLLDDGTILRSHGPDQLLSDVIGNVDLPAVGSGDSSASSTEMPASNEWSAEEREQPPSPDEGLAGLVANWDPLAILSPWIPR